MSNNTKTKFFVELIKPSHYDDDGYVIQWRKSWIPSNTLACINALSQDASEKSVLGDDVEFVINAYDEMNILEPWILPDGSVMKIFRLQLEDSM